MGALACSNGTQSDPLRTDAPAVSDPSKPAEWTLNLERVMELVPRYRPALAVAKQELDRPISVGAASVEARIFAIEQSFDDIAIRGFFPQ